MKNDEWMNKLINYDYYLFCEGRGCMKAAEMSAVESHNQIL